MQTYNAIEIFFLTCAGIGGTFFIIWLILQFIGMGDIDADVPTDDAGFDADASFKLLSLQGLTAFSMMFGLVGFGLYNQSHLGSLIATIGALVAGLGSVWIIGKIFSMMMGLQSSGTLENTSAIGCEGTVYLTIPAEGTGSVQINMQNRLREFDAVSHNKEELTTGERIRVVWVNGNVLAVEKVK